MILHCWDIMPENRPTFQDLYANTSKFIEAIAGYLEIGMNPFSGQTTSTNGGDSSEACDMEYGEEDFGPTVSVNIIPPSPNSSLSKVDCVLFD